jgi:hypothetical protein
MTVICQRNWRSGLARNVLFFIRYFSDQPPISITPLLGACIYVPALALVVSPDAPRALYSLHSPARRRHLASFREANRLVQAWTRGVSLFS